MIDESVSFPSDDHLRVFFLLTFAVLAGTSPRTLTFLEGLDNFIGLGPSRTNSGQGDLHMHLDVLSEFLHHLPDLWLETKLPFAHVIADSQ